MFPIKSLNLAGIRVEIQSVDADRAFRGLGCPVQDRQQSRLTRATATHYTDQVPSGHFKAEGMQTGLAAREQEPNFVCEILNAVFRFAHQKPSSQIGEVERFHPAAPYHGPLRQRDDGIFRKRTSPCGEIFQASYRRYSKRVPAMYRTQSRPPSPSWNS